MSHMFVLWQSECTHLYQTEKMAVFSEYFNETICKFTKTEDHTCNFTELYLKPKAESNFKSNLLQQIVIPFYDEGYFFIQF